MRLPAGTYMLAPNSQLLVILAPFVPVRSPVPSAVLRLVTLIGIASSVSLCS